MRTKKFFSWLLVAVMCVQMLSMTSLAAEFAGYEDPDSPAQEYISGDGVRVTYENGRLTLYLVDGDAVTQMSKPSSMGYPIVNGVAIQDFTPISCNVERNITSLMGTGERMTILNTQNKRVWIAYVQYWVLMLREFKGIGSKSKTLAEFA